jgi:murein DD-endopeptidase MepM/ murein hydrolase activator NlpD
MRTIPEDRKADNFGEGYFGASRGNRTHNGVDKAVPVGTSIYPIVGGEVTKLGYPYGDDLSFRYVQVSDRGIDYRYFYVSPLVSVGDHVTAETVLGKSQKLKDRYPGITEHVHFEVKVNGKTVDPNPYLES